MSQAQDDDFNFLPIPPLPKVSKSNKMKPKTKTSKKKQKMSEQNKLDSLKQDQVNDTGNKAFISLPPGIMLFPDLIEPLEQLIRIRTKYLEKEKN